MPITVERDELRHRFILRLLRSVNLGDVQRFISEGTPAGSGYDVLVDLRGADLGFLSSDDARALAELAQSRFPGARYRRVAILATDDSTFGTARMYATYREASGVQLHVFRSLEDAERWLAQPRDTDAPGAG